MTNIELDMEYISLYARQMNVSAIKAENDKVIFRGRAADVYGAVLFSDRVFSCI